MNSAIRDRQYNFRTNHQVLDTAKEVLLEHNMSLSDALNLFLEQIVETGTLPIKTPEQIQAQRFLNQLTNELDKGYQDLLNGHTKSDSEVFEKYDL